MPNVDIAFDTYYTYAEMTSRLEALADAYPDLATLTSVAKTLQGRDVWLIEINNPRPARLRRSPAIISTRRFMPKSMPPAPQRFMPSGTC